MANQTLALIEVRNLSSRELNQLTKKTYAEIYRQTEKYFCVTAKKAVETFQEFYMEIIPWCARILTADGIEVFVAKIRRHLIATEPKLYQFFKDNGAVDEAYKDVTIYGGEKFKKLSYINWCEDTIEKKTEYRIPKVRKGNKLFYVAA